MARAGERHENEGPQDDTVQAAPGGHGGSSVKQGMAGQSTRSAERGRDEFQGNGASAELDPGRTREGGRHYGRPAIHEPAPDGGPPGAIPGGGEYEMSDDAIVNANESDATDEAPPEEHTQGRHGGASVVQGRRSPATPPERGSGRS
jgi:hypothetical protein